MPDRRRHRGAHPQDAELFAAAQQHVLARAAAEYSWLLDRGYSSVASLKLVGDRYQLRDRQRTAIARCGCTTDQHARRLRHRVPRETLAGQTVSIDGYNVLTTVEAALGGAVLILGRDTVLRDMCSMHGTYRRVAETERAAGWIGEFLAEARAARCVWLLDSPVSNSGRLKAYLRGLAESRGWPWELELVSSPDETLIATTDIVATADSAILDRCERWFPLAEAIVRQRVPQAWVLDLSQDRSEG